MALRVKRVSSRVSFCTSEGHCPDRQHGKGEEKCKFEGSLSTELHYLTVVWIAECGSRVLSALVWIA